MDVRKIASTTETILKFFRWVQSAATSFYENHFHNEQGRIRALSDVAVYGA